MTEHTTTIISLPLLYKGKVRCVYEVDSDYLLLVASDQVSAFDVVLPTLIPGKGRVLTAITRFWLHSQCQHIPNQSTHLSADDVLPAAEVTADLRQRSMVVKRTQPLPFEAIVRGYLAGSGWQEYQDTQTICGIPLPPDLRLAEQLPSAIFTPSTKAEIGRHDINLDFSTMVDELGSTMANRVKKNALHLYTEAARYAKERGIIIADTKFEFGIDKHGDLLLIDEVLTPDSSRFWPQENYRIGNNPVSFDKQFIRDYLLSLTWDKSSPAPALPPEIVQQTVEKYQQAKTVLTGEAV